MRHRKHEREQKRQRGQYMTPRALARRIVSTLKVQDNARVLEPSCGDGSFLAAIAEHVRAAPETPRSIDLVGVEVEPALAQRSRDLMASHADFIGCSVCEGGFFRAYLRSQIAGAAILPASFDLIIGNPPFGGSFDPDIEDVLDDRLGRRLGRKVKKETYAFFLVACVDLLRDGRRMAFVCSDSVLTIPTMAGLRHLLMEKGHVHVHDLRSFSSETTYPMVVLEFTKGIERGKVEHNSVAVGGDLIRRTPNLSWRVTPELARLYAGTLLGDYFIASSGMTTGKNELFVREVEEDGCIVEHLDFDIEALRLRSNMNSSERVLESCRNGEGERSWKRNETLKTVVNHTRNIQSKDVERMPYPWWVHEHARTTAIALAQDMIADARSGVKWTWSDEKVRQLGSLFEFPTDGDCPAPRQRTRSLERMVDLFNYA